ncbi:sulfotransferase [Maricaulis sp.]|uniref:sulfotransferase n=1 Tax=Maricaulis sp. TaxID=1486257 RepID=UPI0025F8492D|nr:sulfotransferase [Maricaulis sp.]MDF1770064.1 sulfotransferase [Maricaulis sp.]
MVADPRLAQARELRLQDAFDQARALCHAVLEERADDAEAMGLLGICDIECGNVAAGRAWLDKAEAADGNNASVQLYRSVQFEAEGNAKAALDAARRASECDATRFDIWGRLGDLAGIGGNLALAAECFETALKAEDDHPARASVALRLAGLELRLGRTDAADAALKITETAFGGALPAEGLAIRAAVARNRADWPRLRDVAQDWLDIVPDDNDARGALAQALSQLGYYRRAIEIFRPVVAERGSDPGSLAALGRLYLGARDTDTAREAFEAALAVDPNSADALFGLARIGNFAGRVDDVETYCRRILAAHPGHLDACAFLAETTGGRVEDPELAVLEAAREDHELPADRRAISLFALGDVYHRRKRRADAFATWTLANEAKWLQHNGKLESGYDREAQEARIARLSAQFDGTEAAGVAGQGPTPIFIVGMPRSGTTLLEAAISAHDAVEPSGELPALPFILERFETWAAENNWQGGRIPDAKLAEWRAIYVKQLGEYGLDGAQWVTDKQPSNFQSVGLIRQLFPNAPVIHIRRRPLETAFSIYRRNFTRQWPFAHSLDDIGHYYAEQARLCDHWRQTYPQTVTPIQYETLVTSFEASLRGLFARIGLPWDDKCLEFYKQERQIMTFSAMQVRRPPSADHLDSTTPYLEWLGGFDPAVEALGVNPETGAWLAAGEDGEARLPGSVESGATASAPGETSAQPGGFWQRLFGRGERSGS